MRRSPTLQKREIIAGASSSKEDHFPAIIEKKGRGRQKGYITYKMDTKRDWKVGLGQTTASAAPTTTTW